ncbi:MAG: PAS domain S-box protein [Chitinophagaceae bacterium]
MNQVAVQFVPAVFDENNVNASIIDSLAAAVIGTDNSGIIRVFNNAASALFNIDPSCVYNHSLFDLLTSRTTTVLTMWSRRVLLGQVLKAQRIQLETRKGFSITVTMTISPINDELGRVTGFTALIHPEPAPAELKSPSFHPPHQCLPDTSPPLISDSFRFVKEITETDAKLRKSEEGYRYLFHHNPAPMWIYDQTTLRFLAVNEAASQQYGYTAEEFKQLTVLDIRSAKDAGSFRAAMALRRDKSYIRAGEFEHLKKDGSVIYVDIVSHGITFGGVDAIMVLAKDITEEKKARQLLIKSNQENTNILESIGDGFFSVDKNFTVIYWNKTAERIVQVQRANVLGKNLFDYFKTIIPPKTALEFRRAMREGVTVRFEDFYPTTQLWVEAIVYPSEIGLSVYFKDITRKKQAIDEISKANEKFSMIARITNDAIYELDMVEGVVYWGEGYANLFGHDWVPGKMPRETWRGNLHPDELPGLLRVAEEAFRNKTPILKRELRFRCADGTYKLVDDKLLILYNQEGKPFRLMGAMQDITEKRRLELSLQRAKMHEQRAVTRATIQGQEREREQIGLELHDNINQILATANLYIEHGLSFENIKPGMIIQGKELVHLATKEIRKLSHALLPPAAGDFGLIPAINDIAMTINLIEKFLVKVDFCDQIETGLSRDHKLTIYRIVQEQLNNTLKHAKCTEVLISLKPAVEQGGTVLIISDNGIGFDTIARKKGIGLRNIVGRAELLNGKMEIESSPGNGCKMTVTIPGAAVGLQEPVPVAVAR